MEKVIPLQISIPNYKEVRDGNKPVIYYTIQISKKTNQTWVLEKRFKEFDMMHETLKKIYANLPALPGKTLFALKTSEQFEKRREELENYLKGIVARDDVLNAEVVKRFLMLDNYAPETTATPPKLLGSMDNLVLGVRDFEYQHDKGLIFTSISDMSVTSRVDSYLTNMKMPWEKDLPPGTLVTVGAVECYVQSSISEFKFDRLWTKTYQTQIIVMYWEPTLCILVVGGDDGTISILKVSSELNYIKYDEIISNKLHQARVMGTYLDSITGYCYSVGEDKRFKVYNYTNNDILADLAIGKTSLTCLLVDKENRRAFITNRSGEAYIYDISTIVPRLIHIIQAHPKGAIRACYFDLGRNYLITGNYDDGILAIHDLEKPGKEKYAHNIANLHGKCKVRCCAWSSSRSELISGNDDGTVTFWNAKKASPIYVLDAHTEAITRLKWIESKSLLVTGGKDKKIKFYQLPPEWKDKKLEEELEKEANIIRTTSQIINFQKAKTRALEDSDEDDLAGWHK